MGEYYLNNEIAIRIRDKIRKKMKEKGISQCQLYKKTGITEGTISKYVGKNAKTVPDIENLIKICDALEMSLDELLEHQVKKEYSFKYSTYDVFYNLFMIYSEGIVVCQNDNYGSFFRYFIGNKYNSIYEEFFRDIDRINEFGIKDDKKIGLIYDTIQDYSEKLDGILFDEENNGNKTDIDYELPF